VFEGETPTISIQPDNQGLRFKPTGEAGYFTIQSIDPPDSGLTANLLTISAKGERTPFEEPIVKRSTPGLQEPLPGTFQATLEVPKGLTKPVLIDGIVSVPVVTAEVVAMVRRDSYDFNHYVNTYKDATASMKVLVIPKSNDTARIQQLFSDNDALSQEMQLETFFVALVAPIILFCAVLASYHIQSDEKNFGRT
jgi:hypothetical protein